MSLSTRVGIRYRIQAQQRINGEQGERCQEYGYNFSLIAEISKIEPLPPNPAIEDLPAPLMSALEHAAQVMYSDPQHQFPATLRRDLYKLLRKSQRANAVSWLSIMSAERVLPIAQAGAPDQAFLAVRLLAMAKALAMGHKIAPAEVHAILNPGYYALVEPFMEDENLSVLFTFRVNSAFYAAFCALMHANGYLTLQQLTNYRIEVNGQMVSGKKLGDEYIARIGASDAAAAAAVAEAWDSEAENWNCEKLKRYWQWWLFEALPAAWDLGAKKE